MRMVFFPPSFSISSVFASTASSPIFFKKGIFYCKFVSINTMSFLKIDCRNTNTSQAIFFVSHCLKMIRIYASAVATQVVNIESFWDSSFVPFVHKTMHICSLVFNTHASISSLRLVACPYPARVSFFNKHFESFFNRMYHVDLFAKLPELINNKIIAEVSIALH